MCPEKKRILRGHIRYPLTFKSQKCFTIECIQVIILGCPGDRTQANASQWWQEGRFSVNQCIKKLSNLDRVLQEPEQDNEAVGALSQEWMNIYPAMQLNSLGPFQFHKITSLSPILEATNSTLVSLVPPLTNYPSLCNLQNGKDCSAGTSQTSALVYYCTKSMEGKPITYSRTK